MSKKLTVFIVVILLIILAVFLFTKDSKLEAPIVETEENVGIPVDNQMPAFGEENVDEMVVSEDLSLNEVKEFTVMGDNFSYNPKTITVKKGDKVKITFKNTEGFHDFKIDEYGIATKQVNAPNTEVLEFTADKIGTFEYYCSVGSHRAMGMVGTLVVEE